MGFVLPRLDFGTNGAIFKTKPQSERAWENTATQAPTHIPYLSTIFKITMPILCMKSEVLGASNQTVLYQHDPLTLTVSTQPDERAIALLRQTTYGTKGVRYRQTGQAEKIHQLHNPYFFHLYHQHELIGFYCLDQRPIGFPGASVMGYYGRYLAVQDEVQGNGYGQLLKSIAIDYIEHNAPTPYLFYSYIEAQNIRSMSASLKEGFAAVAQLKTYMFRRFSPKIDPRFRHSSSVDPARVLKLIEGQFAQYGFQNFININYQRQYFTLEENGRILAGVQANPVVWQLVHIPGKAGPLIKHIAPFIPGLRRFFNPNKQAFVVLEGVYVEQTRPDLLPILLESVLAHFNHHTAMWQIDEKDPLIHLLKSPQLGRFSQFQPGVTTLIMVKGVGLPPTVDLSDDPAYVSCFDYS